MDISTTVSEYQHKVDTKLRIRQGIFVALVLALMAFAARDIYLHSISLTLGLSGFIASAIVGLGLSRMFKIFWHQEKGKVTGELDAVGVVLLIIYIVIEVERTRFFSHWLSGQALTAFSLIVLTGLIFGRFFGTFYKIKTILDTK